jgi:histidinol-phosphate/aromatic aminotransferase/cobyric acid decarboxylase-like protein
MTASLSAWHAACNRRTSEAEHLRSRQFGLQPVLGTGHPPPFLEGPALPGEIWAWQEFDRSSDNRVPDEFPVRVGFAGRRLHLGHLGLARTAAQIAASGGKVLIFDAATAPGPMAEDFRAALHHYADAPLDVEVVEDHSALHRVQHQALSALRLEKLRRLYGWDDSTRASALTNLAAMLGFFLYSPHGADTPGFALVDAMQAPHSTLLPRAARAAGALPPTLLYRRLFPSLRRLGERGSVHEPSSVVFADDDERTVRRKFMRAVTGGRAGAEEQRERGGDPARCAAFAMIELLCPQETARTALAKCQSGQVLCAGCKNEHAETVTSGVREVTARPLRAGHSPHVRNSVAQAADDLYRPPPREAAALEALIATRVEVTPDQVVVGHGSTEIMDWLFRLQSRPGGKVIATEPTFELYQDLADRHRLEYVAVPWDPEKLGHDIQALSRAIDENTVLCVLDIPHTVSGVGASPADLIDQLAQALPRDALLLLDMVYADFMRSRPTSARRLLELHPNAVLCGSLSKARCLLGARVGYGLAALPVAERLRGQRLPYAMDSLALAAAETSLRDDGALRLNVSASLQARDRLTTHLRELGLPYAPTEANFLLMNLGALFEPVAQHLRARGERFRDGRRWGMPGWMQVHLIDLPLVEPVIEALRQVARDNNGDRSDPPSATATA